MPTSREDYQWQRLHGAALFLGMVKVLRSSIVTIFLLVFWARRSRGGPTLFLVMFGTLFLIFPMLAEVLRFISFRYCLESGNVTIREGIFSRKIRNIPVKRIHNINTSQGVLSRLLRVVRVDIETAGGSGTEASLSAVSGEEARRIQAYVREEKAQVFRESGQEGEALAVQTTQEPASREIFRISLKDIFIAGATTYRMGLILVALYAFWDYSEEFFEDSAIYEWIENGYYQLDEMRQAAGLNLFVVGLAVFLLLFFIAWILSIASALIRWYRFTLTESGEDLKISCGLLTLRAYTIPLSKIQALRCTTSLFRRPFGLMQINVTSAGHVGIQEKEKAQSDLLVPITHKRRTEYFVRAVWPGAVWDGIHWNRVHPYTRMRDFRILLAIFGAALFGVQWIWWQVPWTMFAAALVGVTLVALLIADLTYRQIGYADDKNFTYIKTGFLGLQHWVIPIRNIQNLAITQTPFQRIRNLATLRIDVAGSGQNEAKIPNIQVSACWRLFNRFGHPQIDPPKLSVQSSQPAN